MKSALLLFLVFVCADAVRYRIINRLPGPIWVGILGNSNQPHLENGGFVLNANSERTVNSPTPWAGRFWARTWCDSQTNHCETGDCGSRVQCAGAGGVPPVTLVEITERGSGGQDFYDISLVDGFNVKASIQPENGRGTCQRAGCDTDLNPNCPRDLQVIGRMAGYTIACKSSCERYNTDQYCCRGQFNRPETCNPAQWPGTNSQRYFKANCPQAYSYAYDDPSSTFTCTADSYTITFG